VGSRLSLLWVFYIRGRLFTAQNLPRTSQEILCCDRQLLSLYSLWVL